MTLFLNILFNTWLAEGLALGIWYNKQRPPQTGIVAGVQVSYTACCASIILGISHSNMGHADVRASRPVHGSGPRAAAVGLCHGVCRVAADGWYIILTGFIFSFDWSVPKLVGLSLAFPSHAMRRCGYWTALVYGVDDHNQKNNVSRPGTQSMKPNPYGGPTFVHGCTFMSCAACGRYDGAPCACTPPPSHHHNRRRSTCSPPTWRCFQGSPAWLDCATTASTGWCRASRGA